MQQGLVSLYEDTSSKGHSQRSYPSRCLQHHCWGKGQAMPLLANLSHKLTVATDGGKKDVTEGGQRSPLGREKEEVIGIVALSAQASLWLFSFSSSGAYSPHQTVPRPFCLAQGTTSALLLGYKEAQSCSQNDPVRQA